MVTKCYPNSRKIKKISENHQHPSNLIRLHPTLPRPRVNPINNLYLYRSVDCPRLRHQMYCKIPQNVYRRQNRFGNPQVNDGWWLALIEVRVYVDSAHCLFWEGLRILELENSILQFRSWDTDRDLLLTAFRKKKLQ